jgi:hypothetical protein
MNRRQAIKGVIILGAGASLLASCQDNPTVVLKNIPLTGSQEKLLAAITEAILPSTPEFVGAKELESHKFLLMMTDDCSGPEDQNMFNAGMLQFEAACKMKYDKKFTKLSPQQKEEFLLSIEAKTEASEEVITFYQTVKRSTIQSFTSSEAYLKQIRNFSLIPGKFKGCVPVANA